MILHIYGTGQKIEMTRDDHGYFTAHVNDVKPDACYFFMPNGEKEYPDPSSHYQPQGVHGPSAVVDHQSFKWGDDSWKGLPLKDLILYELHIGTFTKEGSFEAIIPFLDDLLDTGINAIELMPVSQFPGERNWGYDGVFPYAVQNSYGGPQGLKKLVNACHQKGIAVFLDVVYNHLGPEGNYHKEYAPYFTDKYATPWGDAINFDSDYSDGVREYFSNNALYWFELYHIDGLRIDAIHMVFDSGAVTFWELMHDKIRLLEQRLGRCLYTIAESDLNSPRVVKLAEAGGYSFSAQWLDDFHHALYVLLDKKGKERYIDFGLMEQLAKAYTDGFVHSGEFVKFRKRRHGASSVGIPGNKFVAFNLNHDQVGNRIRGERLCTLVDFERLKLAAAALMFAPYIPMLFMGEEYADESPFFYFVSHSDEKLIKAVREGRKNEFAAFKAEGEPPDAQDEKTFVDSKLKWDNRKQGKHAVMLKWHKHLISLRRKQTVFKSFDRNDTRVYVLGQSGFVIHRKSAGADSHILCMFNLSETEVPYVIPGYNSSWEKVLDSKESQWLENPESAADLMPPEIHSNEKITLLPLSVTVYGSFKNV